MQTLTYSETKNWSVKTPNSFTEKNKPIKEVRLGEYYRDWNGYKIHVDHYSNEIAPAKIIILHGLGGTGRLLSFIGIPLWKAGFEILCPDLPPFGLSINSGNQIIYKDWVSMVNDLINHEKTLDDKPIFLLGHGSSGMLVYHVATFNKNLSGIIVTSLFDISKLKVRMNETTIDLPTLEILNRFDADLHFPLKELIDIKRIINNIEICKLLCDDPYSWQTEVNIKFLISFLTTEPSLEPEYFDHCPVLFTFPEKDLWMSEEMSQIFFDRLASPKRKIILKNAGHLPIEEPGYSELVIESTKFIKEIM